MRNLLALTRNETLKVLRKRRFFVVVLILLCLIPLFTYGQYTSEQRLLAKVGTTDWKAQLQTQITETEHRMQSSYLPDEQKKILALQVEQNKYYLDRGINPKSTGATTFTRFFMQYGVSLFLPLLVIVVATDIVSSEHSEGTIKLLLTRPVKRWKILLSKYLTLLIYTTLTVVITGVACYLISGLFFGYQGWDAPMFTGFQIANGTFDASHVQVIPHWRLLLMNYGLGWISVIVVATLSFMVSVLVRSTAAGMGVMLAILIGGNILVQLAADFPLAKYLFTSHLRLTDYVNGTPLPIPDVTLGFSLAILTLWTFGGLLVSFLTFTRRDVLA
ncbi:ABC-2 type transport system permease protein [Tumebacillus permanentifrigoris]|uniref:ABC-2 type transport system permease protein n=1 Tax=Tumebacillus permanentifrigoris TaxID=378543 RepID=A0A316DSD6_9BACL|nr:ABC transporter permease [Tumebacillus permanentifrigoris]PWK08455.1 ABC-2 type transport system permease protein [Tumebacillus permanentifrigoris]